MSDALVFIVCMCITTALCAFASYKPGDKTVRFGLGIILFASLASAIPGALGAFSFDFPEENTGGEVYEERIEESFLVGVGLGIAEEFSLDPSEIKVYAKGFDYGRVKAEAIYVTLTGRAALADIPAIRKYIIENNFCEGEVRVDFG